MYLITLRRCILIPVFSQGTGRRSVQETDKEMCFNTVFILQINRSCRKICFHDTETFFYLPSSFTDFQNTTCFIIQKICTYCVEPIIPGFFWDLVLIQVMVDISSFPFSGSSCGSDKTVWIIWVFTVFFVFPVSNIFCARSTCLSRRAF